MGLFYVITSPFLLEAITRLVIVDNMKLSCEERTTIIVRKRDNTFINSGFKRTHRKVFQGIRSIVSTTGVGALWGEPSGILENNVDLRF